MLAMFNTVIEEFYKRMIAYVILTDVSVLFLLKMNDIICEVRIFLEICNIIVDV